MTMSVRFPSYTLRFTALGLCSLLGASFLRGEAAAADPIAATATPYQQGLAALKAKNTTEAIATFSFGSYYGSLGMSAGDLDADGYLDLLLPSMYDAVGAQAGSLRAVYGPLPWGWTDVTTLPDVIYGDPAGRLFGYRTEISDLDGDGGLDIVARADDGLRLFRGGGF